MISSVSVLEITSGVVSLVAFMSLAALPWELAGQTPYDFPIPAAGDRFVYANDDGTPTGILNRFGAKDGDFVFYELRAGSCRGCSYIGPMLPDSAGILVIDGPRDYDISFYPIWRPVTPLVRFDGMEWTWSAFDTTVFGRSISAITYRSGFGLAQRVRTVGEHFGLLYDRDKGEVLRLNSAVVDGIAYNRDTLHHDYISLCEDRLMQYRGGWLTGFYLGYSYANDRIQDGIRYALHPIFVTPLHTASGQRGTYLTAGPGGVTTGVGVQPFISATASIGDLIGYRLLVIDTSSMRFGNGVKRVLRARSLSTGEYYQHYTIVESIGLLRATGWAWEWGDWDDTLVYYSGCGESWGTPVSVPDEVPIPTRISLSVSPSPSSVQQGLATVWITSTTSGEAALRVTDVLGKLVHEERTRVDAGSHPVHLGIDGYTSGMYIVTVTVAAEQAWTKLLVR